MAIHQVLVSVSEGDAVANTAFELRTLLRRLGPSEIVAPYYDAAYHDEVVPLSQYRGNPGDILCYHAAIGEPLVASFLAERPEPLVLVYHNISPGDLFRGYDPAFAAVLDRGRDELRALAPRVRMALAPSVYNAAELTALGFADVRVSPLVVDVGRLTAVVPYAPTAEHLATQVQGPVALFVGQMLPHKRPDLLVQAFHILRTYLVPDAHLIMAGAARVRAYTRALQLFAHELNLPMIWFAGRVHEAELAAFYRRADVFVTASEHEGFCVPLLEAMAFDLPIVARSHAAIPETLAGAGLLLPPQDDPTLLAEALATVMTDATVRNELVDRGRRRLRDFDVEAARSSFLGHMRSIA